MSASRAAEPGIPAGATPLRPGRLSEPFIRVVNPSRLSESFIRAACLSSRESESPVRVACYPSRSSESPIRVAGRRRRQRCASLSAVIRAVYPSRFSPFRVACPSR